MAQKIRSVDRGSPAQRAGLRAGDEIVSIGGTPVIDFLDYQALTAHSRVQLTLRRDGQERSVCVRKGEYEAMGLNFEKPMMSGMRMCCNHCLFCFVDQLPAHVRPSMRVKDDDWRMSLMMGNYVTLTNVSDREIERMIRLHASPLYISVHAADPDLRSHILGQARGARLMDQLRRLSAGGIEFHTQAVLCPGVNDGPALEETINALAEIPGTRSLALVPVGLTGHREGLTPLRPYAPEEARGVIEMAQRHRAAFLQERGTRFVFPADEFYLIAGMDFPPDEAYEDYAQIDDGVGMVRLLETEFDQAWQALDASAKCADGEKRVVLIGCGVSVAPRLRRMLDAHPLTGVRARVIAVENRFFGPTVTVSGLVTGGDLCRRLEREEGERILITCCMLRSEGDRFLDDMTLEEAQARLGRRIVPVGRGGEDLLLALMEAR